MSSKKCLTRASHKSVKQELLNSVKQGCPTRVSPQCVNSGCLTNEFVGNVTNKYCLCLSTYVSAFGFVGFILFSFLLRWLRPTKNYGYQKFQPKTPKTQVCQQRRPDKVALLHYLSLNRKWRWASKKAASQLVHPSNWHCCLSFKTRLKKKKMWFPLDNWDETSWNIR